MWRRRSEPVEFDEALDLAAPPARSRAWSWSAKMRGLTILVVFVLSFFLGAASSVLMFESDAAACGRLNME